MTSYELMAAERSAAIQSRAAERARRATQIDEAFRHHRPEAASRRLRLRLHVSRPA